MHCKKCRQYTLELTCPRCNIETIKPLPPRFSPQDKYGRYRRKLKLEVLERK